MDFEDRWRELIAGSERTSAAGIAVSGLDGDVRTDGDDLLFPACSISKHVAAFGTLRLVADGVIDLDTDVNAYLSTWRLPGSGTVTVRQLLAHTAGLTQNWFPGYAEGEPVPSLLQILRGEPPANTPAVRRDLPPGAGFRYSGSHYAVLEHFGHTGQNTGYSCFSYAWPASGTAVAVMTNADDCRDTLVALIELAGRRHG